MIQWGRQRLEAQRVKLQVETEHPSATVPQPTHGRSRASEKLAHTYTSTEQGIEGVGIAGFFHLPDNRYGIGVPTPTFAQLRTSSDFFFSPNFLPCGISIVVYIHIYIVSSTLGIYLLTKKICILVVFSSHSKTNPSSTI